MLGFHEFFAGGGMARLGLGARWRCLFANDFDEKKRRSYARHWGHSDLHGGDVAALTTADLPGVPDLAWASFPCQDLSLAGSGAGLNGGRSGTFWPFWRLIEALRSEGRAPRMVVLENVAGALTSHDGQDFGAIAAAVTRAGYRVGALVVNAALFLPQSRPRLFVIAADMDLEIPQTLRGPGPDRAWTTAGLARAAAGLDPALLLRWIWWRLPMPCPRRTQLADLLEKKPTGVEWHSPSQTRRLLNLMAPRHRAKVRDAERSGQPVVGAIYRRTRLDDSGRRTQRAEIRFDGMSGCLRTGSGGSSRQILMLVEGNAIRSRLLSTREAARLMGLPDDYELPENYREAYHLAGDGVVVPVVRHLAEHILEPVLEQAQEGNRAAA